METFRMQDNFFQFAKIHKKMDDSEKREYRQIKRDLWMLCGSTLGKFDKQKSDEMGVLCGKLSAFEHRMIEKYEARQAL